MSTGTERSRVGDVIAVIQALRGDRPRSVAEIAQLTGLSERAAYRLVTELLGAGAPIEAGELPPDGGRPTATYRLTVERMRMWLG